MAKKSEKNITGKKASLLETNTDSITLEDKYKDMIHKGEEIKEINLSEKFGIKVIYKINCGCCFIINNTLFNSAYYKLRNNNMFFDYYYNNNSQKMETLSEKVNNDDKYLIDLDTVILNKDNKKNIMKEGVEENFIKENVEEKIILDKEAELYNKKMTALKEFINKVKEYYIEHVCNVCFCLVLKKDQAEKINSLIVYLEFNYILYEYTFMTEKYSEQFLDDIEKFCENNIILYYII